MDDSYIHLIEPTELYNILNQSFNFPAISDGNYLLLLDARAGHEYSESHLVTAKKASKDKHGAFSVSYDGELECKQYIVVYDGTTNDLQSKDSSAYQCAQVMKGMGSRNPVLLLRGGYELFSALYPFLRTQKILWLPQDLDQVNTYPVEIIPGLLYMGNWAQGNAPNIQKDLKIKAHLNCTPKADLYEDSPHRLMRIPITDHPDADMSKTLSNACAFIDVHLEKKEAVLVFSELGISRAAAICIAYYMFSKRENLEVAYNAVKKCNIYACPHSGFLQQLDKWHQETIGSVAEP